MRIESAQEYNEVLLDTSWDITFNNFAFGVGLASLDDFVDGGIEFETMWFAPIRNFPDPDIFERNDSSWFLVCSELEVIKTVVVLKRNKNQIVNAESFVSTLQSRYEK